MYIRECVCVHDIFLPLYIFRANTRAPCLCVAFRVWAEARMKKKTSFSECWRVVFGTVIPVRAFAGGRQEEGLDFVTVHTVVCCVLHSTCVHVCNCNGAAFRAYVYVRALSAYYKATCLELGFKTRRSRKHSNICCERFFSCVRRFLSACSRPLWASTISRDACWRRRRRRFVSIVFSPSRDFFWLCSRARVLKYF